MTYVSISPQEFAVKEA